MSAARVFAELPLPKLFLYSGEKQECPAGDVRLTVGWAGFPVTAVNFQKFGGIREDLSQYLCPTLSPFFTFSSVEQSLGSMCVRTLSTNVGSWGMIEIRVVSAHLIPATFIITCELGQRGSCGGCWPQWRVMAKAVVWKGKASSPWSWYVECSRLQAAPVDLPKTLAARGFANSLLIINAQVLFSVYSDFTLRCKYFHSLI